MFCKIYNLWVNISSRLGQVHACAYSNLPKFTFCSSLMEAGKFPRTLNKRCPLTWICPHRLIKVRKWVVAKRMLLLKSAGQKI